MNCNMHMFCALWFSATHCQAVYTHTCTRTHPRPHTHTHTHTHTWSHQSQVSIHNLWSYQLCVNISEAKSVKQSDLCVPSIRELALQQLVMICMMYTCKFDWLTHSALLRYTYRWDKKVWKFCVWLYHQGYGWLWMLQLVTMHTLPRSNSSILQLTWKY